MYFRMLSAVSETVLGPSTAPDVSTYKAMAKAWSKIDVNQREYFESSADYSDLIEFGVNYLKVAKDRGDYRELMSLSLILLGSYPTELRPYKVRSIGAVSNARWMQKVICELKLLLFRTQFLECGVVTS